MMEQGGEAILNGQDLIVEPHIYGFIGMEDGLYAYSFEEISDSNFLY